VSIDIYQRLVLSFWLFNNGVDDDNNGDDGDDDDNNNNNNNVCTVINLRSRLPEYKISSGLLIFFAVLQQKTPPHPTPYQAHTLEGHM
jgi:hypothetical protein